MSELGPVGKPMCPVCVGAGELEDEHGAPVALCENCDGRGHVEIFDTKPYDGPVSYYWNVSPEIFDLAGKQTGWTIPRGYE